MSDDVECQFKDKCSSFPLSCSACKHNTGKKNYYEPINKEVPYVPYVPYPYWPRTTDPVPSGPVWYCIR